MGSIELPGHWAAVLFEERNGRQEYFVNFGVNGGEVDRLKRLKERLGGALGS